MAYVNRGNKLTHATFKNIGSNAVVSEHAHAMQAQALRLERFNLSVHTFFLSHGIWTT